MAKWALPTANPTPVAAGGYAPLAVELPWRPQDGPLRPCPTLGCSALLKISASRLGTPQRCRGCETEIVPITTPVAVAATTAAPAAAAKNGSRRAPACPHGPRARRFCNKCRFNDPIAFGGRPAVRKAPKCACCNVTRRFCRNGGSARCARHNRLRQTCGDCKDPAFWCQEHGKEKRMCVDCARAGRPTATFICPHLRRRNRCPEPECKTAMRASAAWLAMQRDPNARDPRCTRKEYVRRAIEAAVVAQKAAAKGGKA